MGVTCITPSPPSSHPLLSCPTSPLRKTAQISATLALNFQPNCCLRMLQCLSWRSSTLQERFSGLVFGDNLLQPHIGVGLGKLQSKLSSTVWSCKFRNWQARWIADKTRVHDERRFKSLHSGSFVKRIALRAPRNLDSYNLRVSCAAGKEEHGGRREKSGGKHVEVKDHYRVLGIRRQATIPAIKSAFRQLARQFHPDVNKDVDAVDKFKSIRHAYEVLSDETSRRIYDNKLQDQAKSERRNQVYQRQERHTRAQSAYTRSRHRRFSHDEIQELEYSNFTYENEYVYQENTYHRPQSVYTSTGPKGKRAKSVKDGNVKKSQPNDNPQPPQDWKSELRSVSKEATLFLWIVSALWHALGAQAALGLLVCSVALWKDFAVGYRVASGVAWLLGGEKGLAVVVAVIATTRLLGKAYHVITAILVLALWLGGTSILKSIPLPPGAILVMVYECIKLQSGPS